MALPRQSEPLVESLRGGGGIDSQFTLEEVLNASLGPRYRHFVQVANGRQGVGRRSREGEPRQLLLERWNARDSLAPLAMASYENPAPVKRMTLPVAKCRLKRAARP
jgi:hypothetical protein